MAKANNRRAESPPPETHNAGLKSLHELVALTGVSAGLIAQAVKSGFVVSAGRGKYQIGLALVGLIKFLNARQGQLPTYDNAAQCAAATGIPMAVIKQARRATQLGHGGSIALGPLLRACFAENENGENSIEALNKFKALREELRYERESEQSIPRSDVAHAIKRGLSFLFRQMDQRSAVDLPPVLEGLSAADMKRELLRSDEELKRRIWDDWSGLARNGHSKET